jgi:hypothetical protein
MHLGPRGKDGRGPRRAYGEVGHYTVGTNPEGRLVEHVRDPRHA